MQGRAEKAHAGPLLCNQEGGACPRPETQGAMRSQMRSHGWGPLRMAQGSGNPLPTIMRPTPRAGWGARTLIFPASLPHHRRRACCPNFILTLLVPHTNRAILAWDLQTSRCPMTFHGKIPRNTQFLVVCSHPHLSMHQVAAAASKR